MKKQSSATSTEPKSNARSAHLVAGHTPGATVWTNTVRENNRNYNVVIMSGMDNYYKIFQSRMEEQRKAVAAKQ